MSASGGGGWSGPGGRVCLVRRGLLQGGVCSVNRITQTCKNITLTTTSLRPVNIKYLFYFIIGIKCEQI